MSITISVRIGGEERKLDEVTPDWITHQVDRRRAAGERVCVRVTVQGPQINVALSTPGCSGGGGGGRVPNADEQAILELWGHRGLDQPDYSAGSLISFLKQLEHLL